MLFKIDSTVLCRLTELQFPTDVWNKTTASHFDVQKNQRQTFVPFHSILADMIIPTLFHLDSKISVWVLMLF